MKEIKVEVEKTSFSSRNLFARVAINAPIETVWKCLTDYDNLGNFIPGLIENVCLERRTNGARLRQVRGVVSCSVGLSEGWTCDLLQP